MEDNVLIGLAVILFITVIYGIYIHIKYHHTNTLLSSANSHVGQLTMENKRLLNLNEGLTNDNYKLQNNISKLEVSYNALEQRFRDFTENKKVEQEQFELLANRILDKKVEKFDMQHKSGIKEILEPLKDKIKSFEQRIEKTNLESVERHASLRTQLRHLSELNEKITVEAHNLTNALKADTKKQGNWGELILESILDKSGLEKGREYHVQNSVTVEYGRRQQPDVIIDLPDKKKMIIDAKVSLVAYEKFVNADTEEEGLQYMKSHIKSIRQHIDGLSQKAYQDIYAIESPDFVLMFIPIETAFSSILKYDANLYDYAFEKNIVIVTPSTLLATLKTVDTLWKNDKQHKNAVKIAIEAGKMYDKFVSFTDDMEKLGKQLDTVKNTYSDSMNKMVNGTGNLIRRAEKLKRMGAKASKLLSSEFINEI